MTMTLQENFYEAARRARVGEYPDAARLLNTCFQDLQSMLHASRPDLAHLQKIMYSLETMMIMQNQKDWVAVADIIEYELAGLLA